MAMLKITLLEEYIMKTKAGLMTLSLLCAAGVAMAQENRQPEAHSASEPVAAQEQLQVQERVEARKAVRRQGADMRRCLELKDSRAIIRCAEPGRKP